MTGKVTSLDVARAAGVSQSAVSRVFTPGASASARTIEKVRRAAAELGYRPNVLARSLITGQSRIIGLVVAYLDNQFYPDALERLSNALQAQGYHVLVFMTSKTAGDVSQVIDEILDYQVDGIIAASVAMSSELADRCAAAGVPVVLFNRAGRGNRFNTVTTDNHAGGRAIAEFLVAEGHERIGYIAGWEGASTQRDREAGFRAGLQAAGRSVAARTVGDFRIETARDATREMFDTATPPDAVFAANDHMAFAVMDVLRSELGLRVPQDVSVVGFDDVPLAAWPAYDLTTFRQPVGRMVAATVSTLLQALHSEDPAPRQVTLPGALKIRGSTRTVKETP